MTQGIIRLSIVGLVAALTLATVTGCFFGGEEEPEPTGTPDLAATIAAAVGDAAPTDTPAPTPTSVPPTDTPVPPTDTPTPPTNTPAPTPDLQATIDASIEATRKAIPTATPPPPPPTYTPAPTPVPARQRFDGPPCIVAGVVKIGGDIPPAGTPVFAVSQNSDGTVVAEDRTNTKGQYQLEIEYPNEVFDIFVRASDSGVDTPRTSRGCREIRNLDIP